MVDRPRQLWLRCETKPLEHRAALTPSTVRLLLESGYERIYVEKDINRIFKDDEYAGISNVTIKEYNTWPDAPADIPIIGLKELPDPKEPSIPKALEHTHIYFAHCFKEQGGWKDVLDRYDHGPRTSCILDLEFLQDEKGRRVAAFGYHAGYAGTAVGLLAWAAQQHESRSGEHQALGHIRPYNNEGLMLEHVRSELKEAMTASGSSTLPTVMVVGALGRCGGGAVDFARKVGIPEDKIIKWDMAETAKGGPFVEILESDIFVNCIYLSQKIPAFIDKSSLSSKDRRLSVLVDVSCDTTNPNNPVPVYNDYTNFEKPTLRVSVQQGPPLDVVAIDHLPTLLPREASEAFSMALLPSLKELQYWSRGSNGSGAKDPRARVWNEAEALFERNLEKRRNG